MERAKRDRTRAVGTELALEVDVAIVGYGPVGQALAALLGRAGHRVAVFERFREVYRLPRAAHLDHETMRVLQSLGVAERLEAEMVPVRDYQWFGADGELLLRFEADGAAPSAWEPDYMFFQPELEAALIGVGSALPDVTVARGWAAEALIETGAGAQLGLRRVVGGEGGELRPTADTRAVRARWVIGADGANSFVRQAARIKRRDLGFQERWLVVDAEPHDMDALAHLPVACQWCDPRRPTTHIQSGPRHRRWEFMLLPGEQPSDFEDPQRVWSLLEPWYGPGDGRLTRRVVYEFRSMLAEEMRRGHVLLIGDAAHLTPPFLGQGLCAGMRDAANLAWKLDIVLRGLADDGLLDSLEAERRPQNEAVIGLAIELGRVVCELDADAAQERDALLRRAGSPPPLELARLSAGVLHAPADGSTDPLAGALSVQGVVERDGCVGRFDDVVGGGFALIVVDGDPLERLSDEQRELVAALEMELASLDPAAPHGVRDLDGRLIDWLAHHGASAVLVRPDFYVFGSAPDAGALPALLDDLRAQLQINSTSRPQEAAA